MVSITLAGCAGLQGPKSAAPDVGGFSVKGRLAVRRGDDGFTSNFLWQHATGRDEIDLWGPLGQGHSRFVDAGGVVSVTTGNGDVFHEPDADAAMRRFLGFSLPIDALTHWVRGERASGYAIAAATADAADDLVQLDQLGWHLEYSDYRAMAGGRRLPGRIVATSGDVRLTLLPSVWSFGPPAAFDTP